MARTWHYNIGTYIAFLKGRLFESDLFFNLLVLDLFLADPRGDQATPAGDKILHGDTDKTRRQPVKGQPAGQREGKEGKHHRHQPQHHLALRLLLGVSRRAHHHLLLHPHGATDQQR